MGRTKSNKKGQPVGGRTACARCEQLQRALDAAESKSQATQSELQATQCELQASQEREAKLEAQLANLQRAQFGRKSETTPASGDEPSAPDGVSAEGSADTPAVADTPASKAAADRPRRKRGRQAGSPTPPRERRPDLSAVSEWLDVPAHERCCAKCGTAYVACGYKISWLYEMAYQALARKLLRLRYRPGCECASARPVIAPPVARLGTSQLGTSVWA